MSSDFDRVLEHGDACLVNEQLLSSEATAQYFQPDEDSKGQAPLEPNHTEFIFVDDGTKGKYGGEIELGIELRLEEVISGGFFQSKSADDAPGDDAGPIDTASVRPGESTGFFYCVYGWRIIDLIRVL